MKSTQASDETNLTEIEILPDGRILLFGASREVIEVLDAVQWGRDPAILMRLEQFGLMRLEQFGLMRLEQSGQSRLEQSGGQSSSANATDTTTDPRNRCP